uniref:transposase n=1 Tax=Gemmatimonas sp. TaxID=1962908 RepID=UPI00398387E8
VCDGQGLIGREMFAIDGVKLPSNASKHRSGTRAEFTQRAEKLEAAAKTMLDRHRATDAQELEPDVAAKTTARVARLTKDAEHLRAWLATHPTDRHGPTGGVRKSNRTDHERAKMTTDKGVVQGYTGVAAVDAKHQIIVDAPAHGTGSEQELLLPVVEALAALRTSDTVLTADAGYHSEANLAALAARQVTALIADPDMRKRDDRCADREHHTTAPHPLHDTSGNTKKPVPVFTPSDFTYDAEARTCVCPTGKPLNRRGAHNVTNGYVGEHFQGSPRDCAPCALRAQCLRTPETTVARNVAFFRGREDAAETETHTRRMQQRLDTPEGREQYGRRFATVEPVFANLRYNKQLDRFTLRGRTKVNGQWLLCCLVHHIEKLAHTGYAA